MLKIAHISDLHFCNKDLVSPLRDFMQSMSTRFVRLLEGEALNFHMASPEVLEALAKEIIRQDPDVVVVSGDVTTFGDAASFADFAEWSRNLVSRPGGRADRDWLIVPGNHDALKSHLTFLYLDDLGSLPLPRLLRYQLRRYARTTLRPIASLLFRQWEEGGHLSAFRDLVNDSPHLTSSTVALEIPGCPGVTVRLVPFATTCSDPVWMNLGETHRNDWESLNREIRRDTSTVGSLKFVVLHHNPIAAPSGNNGRLSYAYNGMPEGTQFLREIQDAGVDLVLYGHQHEYALLRFDLEVQSKGHAFALGCESSSSVSGGFNVISVADPNNSLVERFVYKSRRGFVPKTGEPIALHLERNRPVHPLTLSARYEMKRYMISRNDAVDEEVFGPVKENCNGIVYMAGRHFRYLRGSDFQALRQVLDTNEGRIRFLQVDPSLVRALSKAQLASPSRSGEGDLWGRTEVLTNLAQEADHTLGEIQRFVGGLGESDAARIDVRVSHTLLPFGAHVRDPDKSWGSMAVKALPVGAIGDIDPAVFRLNRRTDEALFDYYLQHLKYLFLRSKHVCGKWTDEDDLRRGMPEDVLALLARGDSLNAREVDEH